MGISGYLAPILVSLLLSVQAAADIKPCPQLLNPELLISDFPVSNWAPEHDFLNPLNLESEIIASETAPLYNIVQSQSQGVMTIYDFIAQGQQKTRGHLLGLSGMKTLEPEMMRDVYIAISELTGLRTWMSAYEDMKLTSADPNHTEKFMNQLIQQNSQITFLIPRELYSFNKNGILQAEAAFLFDPRNRRRLQNVKFVYGAYEALNTKSFIGFMQRTKDRRIRIDFIKRLLFEGAQLSGNSVWNDIKVDALKLSRGIN